MLRMEQDSEIANSRRQPQTAVNDEEWTSDSDEESSDTEEYKDEDSCDFLDPSDSN